MAEYERSETVPASRATLYAYLADPANLPAYISTMVRAGAVSDGHLHVAAEVEGRHEEGDARFRADSAARRIEWGGSGTSDYHGWLQVADAEPGSSTVTIHLSTTSPDDADQVEQALAETLANIGRVVD
jgi:hypothetical protein